MGSTNNKSQNNIKQHEKIYTQTPESQIINDSNNPDKNPIHIYLNYRTTLPIQTLSSLHKHLPPKKDPDTCPPSPESPSLSQKSTQKIHHKNQLLPSINQTFQIKKENQSVKQNTPNSLISPPTSKQNTNHLKRHSTPVNLFKQNKYALQQFLNIKKQPIQKYYTLKQKIGEGTYGQVFRAICLRNQQQKAIKVLKNKYMKKNDKSSFLSQMTLLSKIQHPSIISLYDVFEFNNNYYVVTQYCKGGSILNMINKISRKSQIIIVNIMKQLLSALSYLHSNNIIHRDIKLENIVFLDNFDNTNNNSFIPIKIIDFGAAVQTKFKIVQHYPIAGTVPYLAPEVIKGLLTEKSDIWSCGVLMIILLTGVSPFKAKSECSTKINIATLNLEFDRGYLKTISQDARDLLRGMLQRSFHKRVSAHKASQHRWFQHESERHKSISFENIQMLQKYYRSNNLISALQCFIAARNISQQERQKLAEIFNQIDHDHNGVITVDQLTQLYAKHVDCHTNQQIKAIVKTIDTNHSGFIDFNEFIVAMEGRRKLFVRSSLQQAFDYFDKGQTGYLQLKEILRGSDKQQIEYYLKQMDTDNDHRISREQFINYLTKYDQ